MWCGGKGTFEYMKNFLMKILHMIYVFGRGMNGNKEEFSHIESDTDL